MTYQEALKAQDVARERYEDLCEYFNNNPHTIELILNDRKEFKAWLERMHWHVLECDKLARKLEALEGKDTDVHSKDITSRADATDAATYAEDGKDAQRLLEELLSAHPDCADCIMHGGDYECDYVHCHKGGKGKLSAQQEYIEQIKWERDTAIQQLKELGYGLGEKVRTDGGTISRQAAIDALCSVCGNDCDKTEFVYDAPQWDQVIMCPEHYALTTLPSAQPEIIRCKDCYWHDVCKYGQYLGLEGYCSRAEEKNNGKTN